jgi:hypothetical protein
MYQVVLFSDIYRPLHGKGMGVYRLANHIRDNGYTVKVIHSFIKLSDQDFSTLCDQYISDDTVLVGLGATVMAHLEKSLFFGIDNAVVEKRFTDLKNKFPRIKTCLGGAQVTGATDDYLQSFKFFDYVIKGQGETAVIALLDSLTKKTKLVTSTITRPKIVTDKTYAFSEFNQTINTYTKDDCIQYGEGLPIELARGCIFKCKFCGYDLIGKKFGDYTKPADSIRAELLHNYENWGTTHYYVADETINDSEEKVDMLLESVQGLPFRPTFGGFLRLDLIWRYPSMAQKLLDWGLEACSFGLETVNDASGRAVGKGLGIARIEQALEHIRKVWKDRVFVNASFILGLKHDSPQSAVELDQWIEKVYDKKLLHTVFVKPLYIMPNTGLSVIDQNFQEHGYRKMDDLQAKLVSDRTRTVVQDDCVVWTTDNYNYIQASYDADLIHKKYNDRKICKGKIGKHNYAFVKSLLPESQHQQLMLSQIYDLPFRGMTTEETEKYIFNLYEQHQQRYLELLKTKH